MNQHPTFARQYDRRRAVPSHWRAIRGDRAFVAGSGFGLMRVDISNPALPTYLGFTNASGKYAYGVAIAGDYAYVGTGQSGLQVVDLTSPTPGHCRLRPRPPAPRMIAVSGNYVYATANDSIQIFDISVPAAPVALGGFATGGYVRNLLIDGQTMYVVEIGGHLRIVDLSAPEDPQVQGSLDTAGDSYDVAVAGLAWCRRRRWHWAAISNPFQPVSVRTVGSMCNPGVSSPVTCYT
ncbi:MAG: hypothetical protein IPP62_14275 [bacterium]|nr:hypothetical protein [bacterium]